MAPSSQLYDLVLDHNWKAVVEHSKRFPQDASYQDEDTGETPLYLACQFNPPLEAVKALVQANPFIVTLPQTRNRDTPLHIAGWYRLSTSIWRVLVQAAAETNSNHVDTTSCLLQTVSKWGRTPLSALCEGFVDDAEGKAVNQETQWERIKTLLLLCGKNKQCNDEEDDTFAVLLAIARLGAKLCPNKVLQMAVRRHREQGGLFVTNHRRCARSRPSLLHCWLAAPFCQAKTAKNRLFVNTFLSLDCQESNDETSITAAAMTKDAHTGRLPLHAALAYGHTWTGGVDAIWQAHSDAVEQQDPVSGLYPFQMAACAAGGCCARETLIVETIYHLLSARPQVLVLCIV